MDLDRPQFRLMAEAYYQSSKVVVVDDSSSHLGDKPMKVQEVMTKEVSTCRADESLAVPAKTMWDRDVGAVPVLGGDGKLVGIITDRDICMAAYFTGQPLGSIPVGEHMSKEVFAAKPSQSIESAEELMRSKQIRRLPVLTEAGELVGMVTLSDLARAAAKRAVDAGAVTATLAAVVQPRSSVLARA